MRRPISISPASPSKYLISAVIVAVTSGIQWMIWPWIDPAPFILFYPAVILASLYGDGISAIILSSLCTQYLFVPPELSLSMDWPNDALRLGIFIISAVMIHQLTTALARAVVSAKVNERKALDAESWVSTILTSIGDAVIATHRDGTVSFMNTVAEKLTQWPLADALHKPLSEVFRIVNLDTREIVENPVEKVLKTGSIVGLASPTVIIGRHGKEAAIEDSAAPIRIGSEGNIEGVAIVFRDITEKYAQQSKLDATFAQLQESETRIRSVLQYALDAVVAMDESGFITQWNLQAETIFGHTNAESIGKRLSDHIIPHRYREAHERGMKHYLSSGVGPVLNQRIEISGLHASGQEFPIELNITPIKTRGEIHFFAFIRDISERKQVEVDRARLLGELEEAVRARDEFIGIASHELKTPITSLKIQFQMASRQIKAGDPQVFQVERVTKRIDNTNRQLDRMARLIDEMLDVSRVAAGKLELNLEPTELTELVKEVADRFAEELEISGSELRLNVTEAVRIRSDRYRIEQVLSNLFTNAIKYGAGNSIRLDLTVDKGMARITMADQGIGVAKEKIEKIFHRFERAISSSNISGLGLGLYISAQIVEAHSGRIWVESELGIGSTFIVELPLLEAGTGITSG